MTESAGHNKHIVVTETSSTTSTTLNTHHWQQCLAPAPEKESGPNIDPVVASTQHSLPPSYWFSSSLLSDPGTRSSESNQKLPWHQYLPLLICVIVIRTWEWWLVVTGQQDWSGSCVLICVRLIFGSMIVQASPLELCHFLCPPHN